MTDPSIPRRVDAFDHLAALTRGLGRGDRELFDRILSGIRHDIAPAPVRISPEVRETIMMALLESRDCFTGWVGELRSNRVDAAIAFVEALP